MEGSGAVAREQQRLIHASFQEREGKEGPCARHPLGAIDELPAAREDLLPDALEHDRVAVERRGQRPGAADVLVDHVAVHFQPMRTQP
jgi:hypothetical protein